MKIKNILLSLSLVLLVSFSGFLYASDETQKEPANDIILIIDNSRSMKTLDRDAIGIFIESLKDTSQLGIISFDEQAAHAGGDDARPDLRVTECSRIYRDFAIDHGS